MKELTDGNTPSDAVLDMLMAEAARTSACEAGSIYTAACLALVARHPDYVKQEAALDVIFDEFDANKNGKLEPRELEGFLKKLCAPTLRAPRPTPSTSCRSATTTATERLRGTRCCLSARCGRSSLPRTTGSRSEDRPRVRFCEASLRGRPVCE
jgi:hypothetical protein